MGRPRKPEALSNAEHQRKHVREHGLKTIRVTPAVAALLKEARKRTKLTNDKVIHRGLVALLAEIERELGIPRPAPTRSKRSARKTAGPGRPPDLFSK
ncbi:hypothetical protein [Sabulicella glaciei]|uniref:Uncharacterized protein n=1 Tax=Sabulicella glaciei TaxID=2984948 RepID=A0ABT3NZU4_9PROT|nr:hypothetical protein [Roseococcus sp. MDT2-1-1]MCW8087673.1 hypothetical protein [Roseococcus sp. MDT2-1-1]